MKRGSQKQIIDKSQNSKCLLGDEENRQFKVVSFSNDCIQVLTENDHKLMNLTQLAKELNVSYDFVKEMRVMGFELPIGGMTTLTYAMAWLNQNPTFRDDAKILKQSKRRAHL